MDWVWAIMKILTFMRMFRWSDLNNEKSSS